MVLQHQKDNKGAIIGINKEAKYVGTYKQGGHNWYKQGGHNQFEVRM